MISAAPIPAPSRVAAPAAPAGTPAAAPGGTPTPFAKELERAGGEKPPADGKPAGDPPAQPEADPQAAAGNAAALLGATVAPAPAPGEPVVPIPEALLPHAAAGRIAGGTSGAPGQTMPDGHVLAVATRVIAPYASLKSTAKVAPEAKTGAQERESVPRIAHEPALRAAAAPRTAEDAVTAGGATDPRHAAERAKRHHTQHTAESAKRAVDDVALETIVPRSAPPDAVPRTVLDPPLPAPAAARPAPAEPRPVEPTTAPREAGDEAPRRQAATGDGGSDPRPGAGQPRGDAAHAATQAAVRPGAAADASAAVTGAARGAAAAGAERPAAPVAPTTTLPQGQQAAVVEQVVARLAAAPSGAPVTIVLDPPELGKVSVRFVMRGGELHVQVLADRGEVAAALAADLPRLSSALATHGDPVQVDIPLAPHSGGEGQAAASGHGRASRGGGARSGGSADEGHDDEPQGAASVDSRLAARTGGLDILT